MKTAEAFFLVALIVVAACGGDDDGSGGAAGKAESSAGAGAGGSGNPDDKTVTCGAKTCRLPATALDAPCCRDEFASECGTLVGTDCRRMRAESDERCPLPDLPGIANAADSENAGGGVSGCCTQNNECGLDLGLGTGCSSNTSSCAIFPRELASKLALITCDGDPLENLPDACKGGDGAAGSE